MASSNQQELLTSLAKTNSTVSSSLHRAIRHHTTNGEYDARTDGLDFLQVKNGMMLSYLIDLTVLLRKRLKGKKKYGSDDDDESDETTKQCIERLMEMKAALEKMRPLEKRMRYQIDKLLALSTLGAGTFAATGREEEKIVRSQKKSAASDDGADLGESNPLAFKPDLQGMMGMFEDVDEKQSSNEDDEDDSDAESDSDDEFKSSKPNIALEKEDPKPSSSVYQPPRLQSMPFEENEQKYEKEERLRRKERDRMQRSELAEVVRAQFTDAPEEEDIRGGAMLGKQREVSKRLAARDADVQEFEETHMIRLTMGKKEKKERKRVMRDELSNLGAIADLGNVVSGVNAAFGDGDRGGRDSRGTSEAYVTKGMRKRKVEVLDHELGQQKRSGRKSKGGSSPYGGGGGRGSGKSGKRR
ncbi:hypothetical protein THAPSDRAFT_268543 [Thalassiosira pseudonana CCMP1335]|uniref:Sas10 C-terminal domain-containing protein n=1 Tax=Thalassiosira pseudonana TaxID=35128 RepID=B8BYV6_THAPS|nr:hypothetical protein THAPSDRAFT_268543 [Thalassiosira pseudonana CCMP1335]EED94443.1 hypothetical protein THAPSDRAFT_268543 [Thalassiosira pseudonana CCMP1335]|eukprot:g2741.t1 g2741   contig12:711960-713270(+)